MTLGVVDKLIQFESPKNPRILEALKGFREASTYRIAKAVGMRRGTTRTHLRNLQHKGEVAYSKGRGLPTLWRYVG